MDYITVNEWMDTYLRNQCSVSSWFHSLTRIYVLFCFCMRYEIKFVIQQFLVVYNTSGHARVYSIGGILVLALRAFVTTAHFNRFWPSIHI